MPETPDLYWNEKRVQAAVRYAAGESVRELCRQVGISRSHFYTSCQCNPAFMQRVDALREKYAESIEGLGQKFFLASKENRIREATEQYAAIQRVMGCRGDRLAEKFPEIAGELEDGLLTHKKKSIGWGENFREIDEFSLDVASLQTLAQLRQEVRDEVGDGAAQTAKTYVNVNIDSI